MDDLATFLRDWIHETPMSLCNAGADTCPDWDLASVLAEAIEERDTVFAEPSRQRLSEVTKKKMAIRKEIEWDN